MVVSNLRKQHKGRTEGLSLSKSRKVATKNISFCVRKGTFQPAFSRSGVCSRLRRFVTHRRPFLSFLQVKFSDCWAPTEQERAPSCICCQGTPTPQRDRYGPDY